MSQPAEPPSDRAAGEPRGGARGALDLAALEPPSLPDRLRAVVGDDWRSAASLVAVVAVVAAGAWLLLRPDPPRTEDVLPTAAPATGATPGPAEPAAAPTTTTTTPAGPLLAHAAGAVASPGLYAVPPGSRIADLLRAAGGPAPGADLDRVNLAEPVVDGSRVYVPAVGEVAPPEPLAPTGGSTGPGADAGGAADGAPAAGAGTPVDLNTATQGQLEALPGVGPATAQAIIDHRTTVGPFRSVEDLLDVRGIGEAKLAVLRPLVVVR